jgi:phosphate transport system substrate-binding protein
MVSRALLETERDLFAFHVARDGLAVVVHRDNPIKNMDPGQVRDVLVGRTANWKELGGRDAPVELAWRSKGQGSVEFVFEHFKLKREQIGPHANVFENADAIKFVTAHPNGVTLASVGDAERSVHAGVPIKLLAFNGIAASNRNIQNRSYALSRPLTLITRRVPEGLQKQFIDYALSNSVVDLQVRHGFVPYQE